MYENEHLLYDDEQNYQLLIAKLQVNKSKGKIKKSKTFLPFYFSFFNFYSVLKLFIGFINAAFIAWKLTVINAIATAVNAAATNIHQLIVVR